MVEVIKARNNDYTLKYDDYYIHSKYNPVNEADIFINKNKELINKEVVVVIGLGLGYHIEAILRNNPDIKKIIVFEYSEEIIDLAKQYKKELINNENVIVVGQKDKYFEKLKNHMGEVEDILIHKPSLEYLKKLNFQLYDLIKNYTYQIESIKLNKEKLNYNEVKNKKLISENINRFIDNKIFKDKPCLVLSAGPSLDFEIEIIKKYRERFNIIAVGSVFHRVIEKNIKPDFVVIIDCNDIVYNQFKGLENEDIPLCVLKTASSLTVERYNGPKYIFDNDEVDSYSIDTGKTVACAALSLGIKFGATEIILIGQDLTSVNGRTHINSYCKMYNIEGEEKFNKRVSAEDINGNLVDTVNTYLIFKKNIEKLINKNKNIRFFNCSKGLKIEGCIHKKFEEYLKRGN